MTAVRDLPTRTNAPSASGERWWRSRWGSMLVTVSIVALSVLGLRTFVVESFWIPSGSMEGTLEIGDRILVEKLSTRDGPDRGDVVVFNGEGSFDPPGVNKNYVKRVIGVAGDTVACCTDGHVTVNGVALEEEYVFEDDYIAFVPVVVPEGEIWVMGDHRSDSADSRYHGTVPVDEVVGRAAVVFWPLGHRGAL